MSKKPRRRVPGPSPEEQVQVRYPHPLVEGVAVVARGRRTSIVELVADRRGPGAKTGPPPGMGLTAEDVLAAMLELRRGGRDVTRTAVAGSLGKDETTIYRVLRDRPAGRLSFAAALALTEGSA